jgi:putative ABC transport system ATP-binding protein
MTPIAGGAVRTTDWVIETEGLARTYLMGTIQVRALRGVDMQIAPGEFVALMGPSGCGKSTLMQLLGCLDTPTAGRYWLEAQDVGTMSGDERARLRRTRIGFVFQTFNLLPRLTALENVALPLLYQRRVAGVRERAAITLAHVGLTHRADHHPAEMSGGECQRVAIARAVVTQPGIILADEPTGNLDSSTGAEIMDLLGRLNAEGRTLLVVSHNAEVAAHAGRILQMHDGQIVGCVAGEDGPARPERSLLSGAWGGDAHVAV